MKEQKDMKNIEEELSIEIKPLDSKKIKPQLFINTDKDSVDISEVKSELTTNTFRETDKYSITPTTFKGRTLFANNKPIVNNINKDLEKIYVQKENIDIELSNINKSLQNLHSINIIGNDELKGYVAQIQKPVIDPLKDKLRELESYAKTLIQYQGFVNSNNNLVLSYQDMYVHQGNAVVRYGINISEELAKVCNPVEEKKVVAKSKASSKSAKDEQDIPLHPLEVLLIKDAIGHLSKNNDNTVLVDIFARESDGKIKLQEFKPETHTIVLYNNKKELLVIDPSNSDFSKHLASNTNKMLISGAFGGNVDILVSSKQLRIYEPVDKNKVGPNPDQFRDCIDIAVKLAFGLNKFKGKVDVKDMTSLDIVKQVTNSDDMNEYLPDLKETNTLRIKQASDELIRKKFYDLSINIEKQITSLANYDSEARDSEAYKKMNNNQLFSLIDENKITYEQTIKNLEQTYKHNASIFVDYVNPVDHEHIEIQTNISGNIMQINEELI